MRRLPAFFVSVICIFLISPKLSYSETTAYFPNLNGDNVKQLLVSDESNFTAVTVCEGPYGASVAPDGANLVVTCTDDNSATVIPTATFSDTTSHIEISIESDGDPSEPRGVAVESRGAFAYVANYGNGTVSKINLRSNSNEPVKTFEVGRGPWGVAAFYDTEDAVDKVYVTNHDDDNGSVSVISGNNVDLIADVGDGPLGAALTPSGDFLYVTIFDEDKVVVIDTEELTKVDTITVGDGPWGIAMAKNGAYAFVTNSNSRSVTIIDTSTRIPSGPFSVGLNPKGVAAPVYGDYAYVVNQGDNTISKIPTSGSPVTTFGENELNGAVSLGAFIGGSPPNEPTELEATMDSSSRIILTWTDNADDALGYKIERRKNTVGDEEDDQEEEEFVQVATVEKKDQTTYTDNSLARDTTYEYRIRTFNEVADSPYSGSASATTGNESFSWCFIHTLIDLK